MPTLLQMQLDAILTRTAEQYDGLNTDLQDYAIKEIDRVRLETMELLMSYANTDNIIAKARLQGLLNDLDTLEQQTYQNGMKAMATVIETTAEASLVASNTAFASTLGTTAVISGGTFNMIKGNTLQYVVNRFGKDGLVLSDRVWQFAGNQKADIEQVLRSGIIRGESVNTLVAKVRKVYETDTWKIKRLVVTEGNVAYRTANSYTAQQSDFVKGLRIHRGIHDKDTHRCSELEEIDRYGMGKGVYEPTDAEVLNPHPNCTSYTTYELVENIRGGANK